ncbi:hypothetical protein IFM61606_02806 [Aspergillus udagawae]|uniref:Uncharacterized protein n=1 Tax=Aspergillus udagawae TaxID=91492 RepID=A0ABQ1AS39_9EURO|nr:hypothetical protein IFM51744_05644 [Aspergillus udagawae]GFF87081.1 hypothetical protein IFM53868_05025 [Aspergillus udagawae]GFG17403.1 hypothetical protein IFM5058_08456 [Aspergillus udagawae]GFG22936.1 hypothetical protein IFM61606_02806 [Aspergillus udagawae]
MDHPHLLQGILYIYITVQMQQSHSSSPQSHPKHGFETVLMGFLMDDPEAEDGRVQLTGEEKDEAAIFQWTA